MHPLRQAGACCAVLASALPLLADRHVVVIARAEPEYTESRTGPDGELREETYVVLPGRHYPGPTVDRTMERMDIREIVGILAPELARRKFVPGSSPATADLLLVVHWGATIPRFSTRELTAQPTEALDPNRQLLENYRRFDVPVDLPGSLDELPANVLPELGDGRDLDRAVEHVDNLASELTLQMRGGDNVTLLGYADLLHRLGREAWSSETERSLRHDLESERYFIIVRAYDLRGRVPGVPRGRPVWSMHLNIRSPGNNFRTALGRMGAAAARYAGENSGDVATVRVPARERAGTVTLGDLIILGEARQD